jgi:hypothetical protein
LRKQVLDLQRRVKELEAHLAQCSCGVHEHRLIHCIQET